MIMLATKNLDEQLQKLEAKIKMLKAHKKDQKHRNENRIKELVGTYYLQQARQDKNVMDALKKDMDAYLKNSSDRKLFDLPPLDKPSPDKPNPDKPSPEKSNQAKS